MILNFCRSCRGSIAVMGAALLGLAVLGTGAAIDFARISAVKGELKRAADAGALAAARMADGAMAEDAATGMVDLTLRDVRGMMDVLDRSYHRQGAEHVVSLTASIRLLVLGVLGDAAMRVGVEAAAVSGDGAGAGQGETAPCLHLGSGPGRMALIVEDGASIVGDGCLLVLASDDPNLVSVDGGTLDIAGFCVDGEADPTRLAILSTRLGLPHLPAGCAPIGRTLPPWDGSCRNYDKARDRRHEGEMEYSIRGGTYCGNTHIHENRDKHWLAGKTLEIVDGSLSWVADTIYLDDDTLIARGRTSNFGLLALRYGYLRAPVDGPYAGIAIIVESPEPMRFDISPNFVIEGRIIAAGAEATLSRDTKPDKRLDPVRFGTLTIGNGARVEFAPVDETTVTVATLRPRLVR